MQFSVKSSFILKAAEQKRQIYKKKIKILIAATV